MYIISLLNKKNYIIIQNKYNSYITNYKKRKLILIEILPIKKCEYEIIIKPISARINIYINWKNDWIEIANNIRNKYNLIEGKYPMIDESINYYLAMLDLAIYNIKTYDKLLFEGYIQHKNIKDDLYYPFNLTIDVKEKDIAEFLKKKYFYDDYSDISTIKKIKKKYPTILFSLVISRLLFPNYYFEEIKKFLKDQNNKKNIERIISKSNKFEEYIEKIKNINS